ncbi:MAG TPA: KEOPS complex subunit Cgi121 [Candidatus Bathyarchaeia archaeon]|nr:KEOPS complex subunit Cgi121 [Candidatus Bathyarchaeia archaeon]
MITIKFLGGAKKSFLTDELKIEKNIKTIADLLEYLQKLIPTSTLLDIKNILVAVNGVDSSALGGICTDLKDGDVISIIPVVHGGSPRRIIFKIGGNFAELIGLGKINYDPINFLETLRKKYPDLFIQGVQSKHIVSVRYAKKIISISLAARSANVLLSNKIETDILMRFAFTRQINDAINKIGLQEGHDSILIVIGTKSSINRLYKEIKHLIKSLELQSSNSNFMKKEYLITNKQLKCIMSKNPLEDLLSEKSAVLFH